MSDHRDYYQDNEDYAEFLSGWDEGFYAKYADTLLPRLKGGKALDVGCGVGQVVARLMSGGADAYGLDVSAPNIKRAQKVSTNCKLYDGGRFPFPDNYFDSAGALNVLEHVEEPEAFLSEIARVTKPGGRVVVSSPNFFRVIGLRDYHPSMRGLANKRSNWKRIQGKLRQMKQTPEEVRFDRMTPIVREPFQPDDDAIIATNPFEMEFFLERNGCFIERTDCSDRYIPSPADAVLNITPLRKLMFNSFVVARKKS